MVARSAASASEVGRDPELAKSIIARSVELFGEAFEGLTAAAVIAGVSERTHQLLKRASRLRRDPGLR